MTFANEASCRRLLIAEDDIAIANQLAEYFKEFGYQVDLAVGGLKTLTKANSADYGVMLADYKMLGQTGLDVFKSLSITAPDMSVVLMTGYPSLDLVIDALRLGVCDIIVKPFSLGDIDRTIGNAFHHHWAALAYREMARKLNLENKIPPLRPTSAKCGTNAWSALYENSKGSVLPEEEPVR